MKLLMKVIFYTILFTLKCNIDFKITEYARENNTEEESKLKFNLNHTFCILNYQNIIRMLNVDGNYQIIIYYFPIYLSVLIVWFRIF